MRTMNGTFLIAAALFTCGLPVFADSWSLPKPAKYYSASKRYYIEIVPRVLESQLKYFEDKVAKKEPAGSKPGVKDNYAKGSLYELNEKGEPVKVWQVRLANDVAPIFALVSDSGEYVVTFDNWHSVGMGDDVVVIYGPAGKMIKKMGLSDIAPANTNFPRSASSVWWSGSHYLDEKNLQLVLKVFSRWRHSPGGERDYTDVRIDLKSGELIQANVEHNNAAVRWKQAKVAGADTQERGVQGLDESEH